MNKLIPRFSDKSLRLLPKQALIKTGPLDHADWNYRPVLGWISRQRFHLAVQMIRKNCLQRLLKIGYGSGIAMPELNHYCRKLYGVDIHPHTEQVSRILSNYGVQANLYQADAIKMPFADQFFDCVVIISAIEFIEPLDAACMEIKRVLRPSGFLVIVTPNSSPLVDLGFRLLTGQRAEDDFHGRRQSLKQTLGKHFTVAQQQHSPRWGGKALRFYTAMKLHPKSTSIPPESGSLRYAFETLP